MGRRTVLLLINSLSLVGARYGTRQGVVEQLGDEGPGLEASESWRCSHALSAAAASSSELRPCARLLVLAAILQGEAGACAGAAHGGGGAVAGVGTSQKPPSQSLNE